MAAENDKTLIRPRPGGGGTRGKDPERTVVRPRPGGQQQDSSEGAPDVTRIKPRSRSSRTPLELREAPRFSNGTLADAASSLLSLAAQIPHMQGKVDVDLLHRQARTLVMSFDKHAQETEIDQKTIEQCRYVLCSLLDEMVLNTQWGEHSNWSRKSLLRTFHQETYGGERVFEMIDAALGSVRKDYEFLEVAYLCLSLGFQGKYRANPKGRQQVEELRGEIYQVLKEARDRYRQLLSPAAEPMSNVRRRLHTFMPVWVLAAVLTLSAGGLYGYLLYNLEQRSDPLQAELGGLVPEQIEATPQPEQPHPEVAILRRALAPEIERGVIQLKEHNDHVSLVLRTGELFASGSADVDPALHPVLDKIAKALERTEGTVIVAGHTDSRAIQTAQFPSNYRLSLARASAVVKYMGQSGDLAGRLLPEGRGDKEPVASNDTPEGRAENRRVTIEVAYADQ